MPGPPTVTRQRRSTAAEVPDPSVPLGAVEETNEYPDSETLKSIGIAKEDSDINEPWQHLHQQPHPQPQPSPMASPKNVRQERTLAIIRSLMRGLDWDQEYRHSRAERDAAPKYVGICGDVKHHREIRTELQTLGYEQAWQRKQWRVWSDSRYVANFSPDLHQEDWPAEEASAPTPGKGGPHPRAATLGNFMEVARRSKAKPARPLHLKCSGPSSEVESAHRGVPPRPRPSASSSSSVAQAFTAPERGREAPACERVCGVPCSL